MSKVYRISKATSISCRLYGLRKYTKKLKQ